MQTLGYFRGRQADHAAMPTVAGDDGRAAQTQVCATALKLFDGAIKNFALRFLALAIPRIKVLCQAPRLFFVLRIEQFDHRARGIHAASGIYSWPDTEAQIVSSHLTLVATSRNFN